MNIFIRLIVLYIFTFIILIINLPKISYDDDPLKFKAYVFCSIFLFEFIFSLFLSLYRKCPIKLFKIFKNSVQSALLALVAYSIYQDMLNRGDVIVQADGQNQKMIVIATTIVLFIAVSYFSRIRSNKYRF